MAVCLAWVALIWRSASRTDALSDVTLQNPFEFEMALKFGALLVVIMLVTQAFSAWFGDRGLYVAAMLSGIADVDAISLSLSRMVEEAATLKVAATGIVIAASCNTVVKAGIAGVIGGRAVWRYVAPAFGLAVLGAGAGLYVSYRLLGP